MEENSEITAKPRGKPFPEGVSGNDNGRPKGQRNYATIYKEALKILADKNATTPEQLEAEMVANAAILARKGDYRFYKDVLDRIHGQATNKTELSGGIEITGVNIRIRKNEGS
jgi:hypothetical protein